MLPFSSSVAIWSLATAVPELIGLALVILIGDMLSHRHIASFALGIFLWYFVDTIQGSSNLLVNAGFAGGLGQVAEVLLFVFGLLILFQADSKLFLQESLAPSTTLLVPLLAAVAVGLHGLGEGSAFGSTAAQTSGASLLGTFGGTSAGVAYVLHKIFEPMMVGALYVVYAKGSSRPAVGQARDLVVLTVVLALPSVLGATIGYSLDYDATYFFALGAGASVYVAFRLAKQAFVGPPPGRHESLKVSLAFAAGFMLIYSAALLHS